MALPEEPLINPRHYGTKRDAADGFKRVIMRLEQRMDALEAMLEAHRQSAIDTAKLEARLKEIEGDAMEFQLAVSEDIEEDRARRSDLSNELNELTKLHNSLSDHAAVLANSLSEVKGRISALEAKPKRKPKKKSAAKKYDPMDDKDEVVNDPPFPGQG